MHLAPNSRKLGRCLVDALLHPQRCVDLADAEWDVLIRTARANRLLGTLAVRIDRAGVVPIPNVLNHLRAGLAEATYRRQMVLRQLAVVARQLKSLDVPMIALKGAAYILRSYPFAEGRLPADVDIMVPRNRLGDVETALVSAGWSFEKNDPYDQHYYRAWSHELPPMRAPAMPLELDLHHNLLPPIGRCRPQAELLFASAAPVDGQPWFTLDIADQVIHAAAHLFQDSDCVGRLRDLLDIDGLLRTREAQEAGFIQGLLARAAMLDMVAPLNHALRAANRWFGTPLEASLPSCRDSPAASRLAFVETLADRCMEPVDPDRMPGLWTRLAGMLMGFRAMWLRMPPWLLAYHVAKKSLRRTDKNLNAA